MLIRHWGLDGVLYSESVDNNNNNDCVNYVVALLRYTYSPE